MYAHLYPIPSLYLGSNSFCKSQPIDTAQAFNQILYKQPPFTPKIQLAQTLAYLTSVLFFTHILGVYNFHSLNQNYNQESKEWLMTKLPA